METSLVHQHVPPPTSPTDDPKCLLELPPDTLLEVFLWAELDALNQIQRASQQCRLLARAATASHSWRARRPCNVQSLALSRLEAGAVSSEALHGADMGVSTVQIVKVTAPDHGSCGNVTPFRPEAQRCAWCATRLGRAGTCAPRQTGSASS